MLVCCGGHVLARHNSTTPLAKSSTTKHAMLVFLSIFRLWPVVLSALLLGAAFKLVSWANSERTRSGSLKQPPSLPVRLTPSSRLDLQPIPGQARLIGCRSALAHRMGDRYQSAAPADNLLAMASASSSNSLSAIFWTSKTSPRARLPLGWKIGLQFNLSIIA